MKVAPPTSLRDRAAQLVMPRLGSNMPPPTAVEEDAERALALVERCPVGGFVLFNGAGVSSTRDILTTLQRRARYPLLISTDMERGLGQQVQGATVFPHAMAFAALDDHNEKQEAAVEAFARASAREARAAGIHVAFAPVADVNRDPRNPIIATRAFGADPSTVARLVRAYHRGASAEGLLTTAKHFPGHGGTHQDSHAEVPVVDDARDVLEATDLVPFRAAIDAGVDLIMTGHLSVPALDPSGQVATLSAPILRTVLRDAMGFRGVVISDSLLMAAVRDAHPTPSAQAAALLHAGVDVLLDPPDPEAMVEGLVQAVERGAVSEVQIDEACGRVWRLKERLVARHGAAAFGAEGAGPISSDASPSEHQDLADGVARRAVRVVDGRLDLLPLCPQDGGSGETLVVYMTSHRTAQEERMPPLLAGLAARCPGITTWHFGPDADEGVQDLPAVAQRHDRVLVALVAKPAAWQTFGLRTPQQQAVEAIVRQQPTVLAALGSPVVLEAFPAAALRLCTFSDVPASQRALVLGLVGEAQIKGA